MINLEKEIRQQPEAITNAIETNLPVIREIVAKAKAAGINNIYFAARGTSDHACVYAQYLFGIFAGVPCTLGTPSVFTKYGAKVNLIQIILHLKPRCSLNSHMHNWQVKFPLDQQCQGSIYRFH